MKKVELGCGASKTQGYIGIDRFELPGVDIIADLNKGIPLEGDSVDVIYMCHALEHLDDFVFIMSEIYRICKDGALVNILSPYQHTSLNIANPYHKLPLNENSFRFVTKSMYTALPSEEYQYVIPYGWGLSTSDNSSQQVDMRCINFEFFYSDEYRNYPNEVKSILRRSINNVCEQFYCNLVVIKDDRILSEDEISMCLQRVEIENRLYHNPLTLREREKEKTNTNSKNLIDYINNEIENHINQYEAKFGVEIEEQFAQTGENIATLKQQSDMLEERFALADDKISEINQQSNKFETDIREQFARTDKNILAAKQQATKIESEVNEKLDQIVTDISLLQTKYEETLSELNSMKRSLLDVIREKEKEQKFYRREWDFYPALTTIPIHREFLDGVILKNKAFKKSSILALTRCLPFDGYAEYLLENIIGEGLNFFVIAGYNAKLLIEFVQDGQIIKQERIVLKNEGHQKISLGNLQGNFYIRFRVADNISTVRLLEVRNRKLGILYKSDLAAFGG